MVLDYCSTHSTTTGKQRWNHACRPSRYLKIEYVPSKRREPITLWRVVIFQKNGVLNHTSVKTSRLETYGIIWKQNFMHRLCLATEDLMNRAILYSPYGEVGKFVTFVRWPREETSSRHGHEKKSDHFFKWQLLKMGWRFHYSATVECKVFENKVMRRLTTQTLKPGIGLASLWMKVLSCIRECVIHIDWLGLVTDESPLRHPGMFHPYWRYALTSNFAPQSAYLEFPELPTTCLCICGPSLRETSLCSAWL
jgi:hypothetical protein